MYRLRFDPFAVGNALNLSPIVASNFFISFSFSRSVSNCLEDLFILFFLKFS